MEEEKISILCGNEEVEGSLNRIKKELWNDILPIEIERLSQNFEKKPDKKTFEEKLKKNKIQGKTVILFLPYSSEYFIQLIGESPLVYPYHMARHGVFYFQYDCKHFNNINRLREVIKSLMEIKYRGLYKYVEDEGIDPHHFPSKARSLQEQLLLVLNKVSKNSELSWNWKIVIVDDECPEWLEKKDISRHTPSGAEEHYFYQIRRHLEEIIGAEKINIEVIERKEELEERISRGWQWLKDKDLIFLDLLFKNGGGEEPSGILECLPCLHRFRDVNRFPLIVGLSRIVSQEWVFAFLKEGADGFITKDHFLCLLSWGKHAFAGFLAQCMLTDWERWSENEKLKSFAPKVELSPPLDEEEEFREKEFIVKRMFQHLAPVREKEKLEVKLEPIKEGKSGAEVYLARPFIYKKGEEKQRSLFHPMFIKIDTLHDMVFEKFAYDKYIKGTIDNFCGRIEDPVVFTDKFAGVSYTAIGSFEDYKNGERPGIIKELLSEMNLVKIKKMLQVVYSNILFCLHSKIYKDEENLGLVGFLRKYYPYPYQINFTSEDEREKECELLEVGNTCCTSEVKVWDETMRMVYRLTLPKQISPLYFRPGKPISLRLPKISENEMLKLDENWEKDINKNSESDKNLAYELIPEILKRVEYLKEKYFEIGNHMNDRKYWYGCAYGDLNLGAILYTPIHTNSMGEFNFWLIDYGKTQKGYVAIDYVKFEVEIRTQILSELVFNLFKYSKRWGTLEELIGYLEACEEKLLEELFQIISEEDFDNPWVADPMIKKIMTIINFIRHLFLENYKRCREEVNEDLAKKEYLYTVLHYCIETLKFSNLREDLRSAPFPNLLSLILAEKAANNLEEFGW